MSLVDSWGASTTYTFSLRLRTSPASSQKEINYYLVETAIYKVSRYQEASLRIKSRAREQLVYLSIADIVSQLTNYSFEVEIINSVDNTSYPVPFSIKRKEVALSEIVLTLKFP